MELIGQIIKKNRISKKLTLDQVAFELKISKETIKKIENNEFDESINKVFYYGHIRSISELLNLNPKETVERFKLENSISTEVKSNYIQKPLNQYSFLHIGRFFSFASIVLIFSLFYFLFISESKKSEYAIIPDLPENYEPIIEKALVDMEINNNQVKISIRYVLQHYLKFKLATLTNFKKRGGHIVPSLSPNNIDSCRKCDNQNCYKKYIYR